MIKTFHKIKLITIKKNNFLIVYKQITSFVI